MRLPPSTLLILALLLTSTNAAAEATEPAEHTGHTPRATEPAEPTDRAPLTAEQIDVLHAAQQDRTPAERLVTFHAERAIALQRLTADAPGNDREALHRRIAAFKRQTTVLFLELQLEALGEKAADPTARALLESRLEHAREALDAVRADIPRTEPTSPEVDR